MEKIAIIVGDKGQDGTILKVSLEKQGFQVVGVGRGRMSVPDSIAIKLDSDFSVANTNQVSALVDAVRPSEIYYLAAHHVSSEQNGSDNSPSEYDAYHQAHVVGLLNFLWAIRNYSPNSRIFYAASSLIFSGKHGPIQNEETPFTPVGFYGLTKTQGILICREFRERYGIYTAVGILYNHESALRQERFLSKKLISSAHKISLGLQQELVLGNLSAEADWGYAPDYIDAFQYITRAPNPDDYVVATGESHSVEEFAKIVFSCFGLNYANYVRESTTVLNRHVPRKVGDSSRLRNLTGWKPTHDFRTMVQTLVCDYLETHKVCGLA